MLSDIDVHSKSGRLAVLSQKLDWSLRLSIRDSSGNLVCDIDSNLYPVSPRMSPDGRRVAFCGNDGRLHAYDIENRTTQTLLDTPGFQASFCEWSPEGNRLGFSAYKVPSDTRYPPHIYCFDLGQSRLTQLTHGSDTIDRFPKLSPSGKWMAFHRQYLDEPDKPVKIYIVEIDSQRCIPLPCAIGSLSRFCWTPDSSNLLIKEAGRLKTINLGDMRTCWSFESDTICSGAFSPDGNRVLVVCKDELLWISFPHGQIEERLSLSSFGAVKHNPTGAVLAFGEPLAVYFLGKNAILYRWQVGEACNGILEDPAESRPEFRQEEYSITGRDGRKIPVQRFVPQNAKHLAILFVHGGPGASINPDDSVALSLLAEGFELIRPAYRGCAGYGKEHQEANKGEYGRGDVWDILDCALDWKRRISTRPLAIVGYSYGGFLTLLSLTGEDVPFNCGISLWGVTCIDRLPMHIPRAFPTEPTLKAHAMVDRSPIEQAHRIRTPLLILHGDRDSSPVEEVQMIQRSVQANETPCDLVIFKGGDHGLRGHREEMFQHMSKFLRIHGDLEKEF